MQPRPADDRPMPTPDQRLTDLEIKASFHEDALDQFPDHLRDQIIAGIRDDATVVRDFTNGEWVAIDVGPVKVALIHRCHLVPSWPRPDDEDRGEG